MGHNIFILECNDDPIAQHSQRLINNPARRNARWRLNTAGPLARKGGLGRVGLAQVYAINAIGKVTASRNKGATRILHPAEAPPLWIARFDWSSLIFLRIWFYNLNIINQRLLSMIFDRQHGVHVKPRGGPP